MASQNPGESRDGSAQRKPAGGWGCTVLGFAALVGILVAVRWSAAVGIPLILIAAVVGWRIAKRSDAIAEAEGLAEAGMARSSEMSGGGCSRTRGSEKLSAGWRRTCVLPFASSTTRVDALALGASRIGGIPIFPVGMPWPHRNGVPLAFLAQFDCREVAAVEPTSPLPRAGHLWFFDDAKRYWAESPSSDRGAIVLDDAAMPRS